MEIPAALELDDQAWHFFEGALATMERSQCRHQALREKVKQRRALWRLYYALRRSTGRGQPSGCTRWESRLSGPVTRLSVRPMKVKDQHKPLTRENVFGPDDIREIELEWARTGLGVPLELLDEKGTRMMICSWELAVATPDFSAFVGAKPGVFPAHLGQDLGVGIPLDLGRSGTVLAPEFLEHVWFTGADGASYPAVRA